MLEYQSLSAAGTRPVCSGRGVSASTVVFRAAAVAAARFAPGRWNALARRQIGRRRPEMGFH